MPATFDALWAELAPIGRDRTTGGYQRLSWSPADVEVRSWFAQAATRRGLDVSPDRNGNLWAWWGTPGPDAVVTGSHLDSVPNGGAFDGPLGVVGALAAVDELRRRDVRPRRPFAIVAFVEEEGGRFGVPCLGSRLMTGAITAERAGALTDTEGVTWARAMQRSGLDPERMGAEPDLVDQIGAFVELHIEQGRSLIHAGEPLGVASTVWPHGRWRMEFSGRADHAGTTRLGDRHDPMLPFARTVVAARSVAETHGAVATVGRAVTKPNCTNAIPAKVRAWLDARAPDEATLRAVVDGVDAEARRSAAEHGVFLASFTESSTPVVRFEGRLRDRIVALVSGPDGPAPLLATGAGHDAGILAAFVPTAMLFVRNPSGVSHAPEEYADPADCHAGTAALATVLADLLSREPG